jgi:hypothetical protein
MRKHSGVAISLLKGLASLILPFLEYEIATPPLREARNDSEGDCHCEERSDEAIPFLAKNEIATGSPKESPRNDKREDCEPAFGGLALAGKINRKSLLNDFNLAI